MFSALWSTLFLLISSINFDSVIYQAILILPAFALLLTGILTWTSGRCFSRSTLSQLVILVLIFNACTSILLGLFTFFFNYTLELSLGA